LPIHASFVLVTFFQQTVRLLTNERRVGMRTHFKISFIMTYKTSGSGVVSLLVESSSTARRLAQPGIKRCRNTPLP
jgi:hypothetical protein